MEGIRQRVMLIAAGICSMHVGWAVTHMHASQARAAEAPLFDDASQARAAAMCLCCHKPTELFRRQLADTS